MLPEPGEDPALAQAAATFVSLERGEALLGCIGTLRATESLLTNVARNAWNAAFADPRLPSVTPADYAVMTVKVSVLSPLTPIKARSWRDVQRVVRPGVDGLLVEAGGCRATLLPSVWEKLSEADQFLDVLWHKAGLRPARLAARHPGPSVHDGRVRRCGARGHLCEDESPPNGWTPHVRSTPWTSSPRSTKWVRSSAAWSTGRRPSSSAPRPPARSSPSRDLINHVAAGANMFAAAFESGSVSDEELGRLMGGDILGDDPSGTYQAASDRVLAAIRVPGAIEGTATFPWGEMPRGAALGIAVFDVAVHGWDLAQATGQELALSDALAEEMLALGRTMDLDQFRGDMFADEVVVVETAPTWDRVVAYAGRTP